MQIIILGAGQVGGSLATHLANEDNDVTVVDTDARRLELLQDRLDLRTLAGFASHPQTLAHAGAKDTDMIIAVTNSDEINMMACQVARQIFNVPKKIARVREQDYLNCRDQIFGPEAVPVDVLISPEGLVTTRLENTLKHPGALQVLDFAGGRVQLVAVKVAFGGRVAGQEIASVRERLGVDLRIVAIFRGNRSIFPRADTVIEVDDEIFFVADKKHIREIIEAISPDHSPYRRILIAGGGNIGAQLASRIEGNARVKLVEWDIDRCKLLSQRVTGTTVLHGNATDPDLMLAEGIENTDAFIAVTNDDESNIMASLLAKKLGARTVITLINNPIYVDVIQGEQIDIAISPQQSTIGALLTYVRRGDVVAVHSLRRGAAEALEAVAHGTPESSQVVGRRIGGLSLPEGTTFGAIVRDREVMMAHDDVVIEDGDHLIVFLADKTALRRVEKLFQVGLGYF